MINFRVVARVFSLVIIIEGFFMLLSAGISFLYREPASLLLSAVITIVTGVLVFTPLRREEKVTGQKEGYIIITGIWLLLVLFGTLPYLFSGAISNFGDAFFESMSGFTGTGATILTDIESQPHGLLFWRSITQWIGGMAFIIVSLSVLQVAKTINIQLAIIDFTGQTGDKIHPKITEAAKRLITIYVILTGAETLLLMTGGMNPFDAVCHSFSTMSTGGFSTRNSGIGAFGSPYILIILTIFMFLAGTNMTIIYFSLKRYFNKITGNNEFVFYSFACAVFMLVSSLILWIGGYLPAGRAFLEGSFQAVSVITTTGFYHSDFNQWGSLMVLIIFILMFTGGTSGSASSGLKIIRLLLITRNTRHEMRRMIHPSAFLPIRLDNKIVPQLVVNNLLVYITLYLVTICVSSVAVAIMGHDIITAFSTSAALLGNIGPGVGTFGPFTNYAMVPEAGKWFFSLLMLIGRIELFSIFVLFTASFYRK